MRRKILKKMGIVERRHFILSVLQKSIEPIAARELAKKTGVSRQVIVNDISWIRANGIDIVATACGYVLKSQFTNDGKIFSITCKHSLADCEKELQLIVDNGGVVKDVEIDHPVYGVIKGELNIKNRLDVQQFLNELKEKDGHLLSEVTDGVHRHNLIVDDQNHFNKIVQELSSAGLLYEGDN